MVAKKNGPGNNKAYMPVPKGYKGNWNVPAGTPWKKDSPYNPANKNKGPTSRGPSPEALAKAKKSAAASVPRVVSRTPGPAAIAAAKKADTNARTAQRKQVVSPTPGPAKIAAAKKSAAAKTASSIKASDDHMMRKAKQTPGKKYVAGNKNYR